MLILGMIVIALVIIGVLALMSDEEPKPKKPWKPKKRLFSDAEMDYSKLRLKNKNE